MELNIPENINEITLGQYQKFELANKEGADEEFVINKMISIFCGIDMRDTLDIKLEQAEEVADDLADVLVQEGTFQQRFEYKGKEWGIIPNLTDITLGEYIDLEEALKDTQQLHRAMAVLYRPITKKYKKLYSIEKYEGASKYSEEMKDLPLGTASAAVVFFYNLSSGLLKASPAYFQKLAQMEQKKKTTPQKDSSVRSGAGLRQYTAWLAEVLPDLMR